MMLILDYTYVTLQLVGLLGADNLRRVPHIAAHALHPVQVFPVVDLFLNSIIKTIKIINIMTTRGTPTMFYGLYTIIYIPSNIPSMAYKCVLKDSFNRGVIW